MGAITQVYGAYTPLVLTGLAGLANSPTAGWISDIIDNRTEGAFDYEFSAILPMANTAPNNSRTIYVFGVPAMHDGSAWVLADGGTTTMPTAGPATYTFAGITATNNFRPMATLRYTAADQSVRGIFFAKEAFPSFLPDGFALFLLNYTGAAFDGSGQTIARRAISQAVA